MDKPLALLLKPESLTDIVGQSHLIGNNKIISNGKILTDKEILKFIKVLS